MKRNLVMVLPAAAVLLLVWLWVGPSVSSLGSSIRELYLRLFVFMSFGAEVPHRLIANQVNVWRYPQAAPKEGQPSVKDAYEPCRANLTGRTLQSREELLKAFEGCPVPDVSRVDFSAETVLADYHTGRCNSTFDREVLYDRGNRLYTYVILLKSAVHTGHCSLDEANVNLIAVPRIADKDKVEFKFYYLER